MYFKYIIIQIIPRLLIYFMSEITARNTYQPLNALIKVWESTENLKFMAAKWIYRKMNSGGVLWNEPLKKCRCRDEALRSCSESTCPTVSPPSHWFCQLKSLEVFSPGNGNKPIWMEMEFHLWMEIFVRD